MDRSLARAVVSCLSTFQPLRHKKKTVHFLWLVGSFLLYCEQCLLVFVIYLFQMWNGVGHHARKHQKYISRTIKIMLLICGWMAWYGRVPLWPVHFAPVAPGGPSENGKLCEWYGIDLWSRMRWISPCMLWTHCNDALSSRLLDVYISECAWFFPSCLFFSPSPLALSRFASIDAKCTRLRQSLNGTHTHTKYRANCDRKKRVT